MDLKRKKDVYVMTFTTEHGAEVLRDLEQMCRYNTTTFSNDSLELARNEGRRQVVLHIHTLLKIDLKRLEVMSKSNKGGSDVFSGQLKPDRTT